MSIGILIDSCLFIAATAIANGLPLATLNRKHFDPIEGLKLFYPEQYPIKSNFVDV